MTTQKKGPPMVTCVICNDNKLVSKRSTLAISETERACRHHPEVQEIFRKRREEVERKENEAYQKMQDDKEAFEDQCFVKAIRANLYTTGFGIILRMFSLMLSAHTLRKKGISKERTRTIIAQCKKLGPMSATEHVLFDVKYG